jgi:tetratricopeptide (TPR) repeat protein
VKFLRKTATEKHPQRVQLLVSAGQLEQDLGDPRGAMERYLEAAHGAEPRARTAAVEQVAKLAEQSGDPDQIIKYLSPFANDGNPDVSARLGLAYLALGQKEKAEQTLNEVLAAGASASGEATARAHFGMAELLLLTLDEYPELNNPELIEEYVTIMDVAQQSYLNAARSGSAAYAAMAFSRLVYLAGKTVVRLEGATVGPEFSAEDRKLIMDALKKRRTALRQTAKEALAACANVAWNARVFTPAVRECMKGTYARSILAKFDRVRGRSRRARPGGVSELRDRLSRNPEDLDALRELASAFLKARDPYSARIVLSTAATRGGGALEANLLGIAAYRVGVTSEALAAFAQAAEGGLEAGRQNLAGMLRQLDLDSAARKALKQYSKGRPGGQLMFGRADADTKKGD